MTSFSHAATISRPRPLDLLLPICPCLALVGAIGIVLSRDPLGQNADGILETIISLQRVTLFFWDQNRFANIVHLLASGIRSPVLNADF